MIVFVHGLQSVRSFTLLLHVFPRVIIFCLLGFVCVENNFDMILETQSHGSSSSSSSSPSFPRREVVKVDAPVSRCSFHSPAKLSREEIIQQTTNI